MSSLRIAAWRMDWRALNLRSPRLLHIYSAEKKKKIPMLEASGAEILSFVKIFSFHHTSTQFSSILASHEVC